MQQKVKVYKDHCFNFVFCFDLLKASYLTCAEASKIFNFGYDRRKNAPCMGDNYLGWLLILMIVHKPNCRDGHND